METRNFYLASYQENLFNVITNFKESIIDKSIYNKDLDFVKFMEKIVFNILCHDDINEILEEIKDKKIFYESFYFAYLLQQIHIKPYEFALNYLHNIEFYDHYYVLDTFMELY